MGIGPYSPCADPGGDQYGTNDSRDCLTIAAASQESLRSLFDLYSPPQLKVTYCPRLTQEH
jgi:hypothetical protein